MKNSVILCLWMIFKSSLFAITNNLLWIIFFFKNFKMFPENPEVMSAVVGGFLVFSALLPSFIISRLSQQYDELKSAVVDNDIKSFKRIYLKNVHPLTYLAIIVVSLLAIIALMMVPYERMAVGVFSVGGLSFVHAFFFFITKELDNPTLLNLKIPENWINQLRQEGIKI